MQKSVIEIVETETGEMQVRFDGPPSSEGMAAALAEFANLAADDALKGIPALRQLALTRGDSFWSRSKASCASDVIVSVTNEALQAVERQN